MPFSGNIISVTLNSRILAGAVTATVITADRNTLTAVATNIIASVPATGNRYATSPIVTPVPINVGDLISIQIGNQSSEGAAASVLVSEI